MKILIIGASSYVGARIFIDLRDRYDVAGTYSTNRLAQEFVKLDITKKDQVSELVKKINPDVIIHA